MISTFLVKYFPNPYQARFAPAPGQDGPFLDLRKTQINNRMFAIFSINPLLAMLVAYSYPQK